LIRLEPGPLPEPTPSRHVTLEPQVQKLKKKKKKKQKWHGVGLDWTTLALFAWASPKLGGPLTPCQVNKPNSHIN